MDIRQSENYARYLTSLGWIREKAGPANIFVKKLPVLNFLSVIKAQRYDHIDPEALDMIVKKYHAVSVNLEPLTDRYPARGWPLLPTKTIVLDLNRLSLPKSTRYEISKARKHGLSVTTSTDINLFYHLLEETMKLGNWSVPIKKDVAALYRAFQPDNSVLLLTPSSGSLLVWDQDTGHYMYAACNRQGRDSSAAYLTLWESIEFCRKKGLKYLDLEGVFDPRFPSRNRRWRGFTNFKQGWGGQTVEYPLPV